MNDLTLEDVSLNELVYYFSKPHDKLPLMKTRIKALDEDDRGKEFVFLEGVPEWMPLYHIKKIPESDTPDYGKGAPHQVIEPVKGIDY